MAVKKKENKNTSAVKNTAESVLQEDKKEDAILSKEGVPQRVITLMQRLGVNVLYENSNNEYFTEKGLAVASENGDKTKIKEYKIK